MSQAPGAAGLADGREAPEPRSRDVLAAAVARLFEGPVAVALKAMDDEVPELLPGEAEAVRGAVPKRRREFALGRACAREALADLGGPKVPILRRADRAPEWPSGYVGSISHCEDMVAAVVAASDRVGGVGLDIERGSPLDPALVAMICRPDEREDLGRLPPVPGLDWAKLTFSAKEAFYKAYAPVAQTFLDFQDVALRFGPVEAARTGIFTATICNAQRPLWTWSDRFAGRWLLAEGRLHVGVTLKRSL